MKKTVFPVILCFLISFHISENNFAAENEKTRILILDDATSALDAVTEKKVMDQLMAESKSLLVIGQKISTVKRMDKILVMDNGKMVGFDTHDNLLKKNKTYQEIFEAQMGGSQ